MTPGRKRLSKRSLLLLAAATALAASSLADTIVLKNGARVEGDLVEIRGSSIEFAENGGSTRRFDRSEVSRIEFNSGSGFLGFGASHSGGRPAGLRERTISVDAAAPWTDTGVEVRSGMSVYFEASGKIQWGPDRKDGPGGEGGNHHNPNRPMPNHPGGALIGRVGGSGPFLVGEERGPIRMRDSGRLVLGINDDYLQDNRGSFRVTIYY